MNGPRALTLTQPWATLVIVGAKRVETRGWRTSYRGWLGIHAAKGLGPGGASGLRQRCHSYPFFDALAAHLSEDESDEFGPRIQVEDLPRGALLGHVELLDCIPVEDERLLEVTNWEGSFGDYTEGRWAWLLGRVVPLPEPLPMLGALSLWQTSREDDSFCEDCGKWAADHGTCEGCGHHDCDCICEFVRTDWPTHPANPDRVAS